MDLLAAAVLRLQAFPPFQELVDQSRIGTEAPVTATLSEKVAGAWLFQGLTGEGLPYRDPEGSGKSVVVLTSRDYRGDTGFNTFERPVVRLTIYSDSTRTADGSPEAADADSRCRDIFKKLNPCFHLPLAEEADRNWSGVRILSSLADGGFSMTDVPKTDGYVIRGSREYQLVTE